MGKIGVAEIVLIIAAVLFVKAVIVITVIALARNKKKTRNLF